MDSRRKVGKSMLCWPNAGQVPVHQCLAILGTGDDDMRTKQLFFNQKFTTLTCCRWLASIRLDAGEPALGVGRGISFGTNCSSDGCTPPVRLGSVWSKGAAVRVNEWITEYLSIYTKYIRESLVEKAIPSSRYEVRGLEDDGFKWTLCSAVKRGKS